MGTREHLLRYARRAFAKLSDVQGYNGMRPNYSGGQVPRARSNSRRLSGSCFLRTGYPRKHFLTAGWSFRSQTGSVTRAARYPDEFSTRDCVRRTSSAAPNQVLNGLDRVRKCFRFTEPKESRAAIRRYRATNDALAEWTEQHTVASPNASVPQADLHGAYEPHCRQSCRRPPSKQMFGRRLRELRPEIELGQRSLAGHRAWV
jgi:hypothetical protein